jgi:1,4-dihydroxy-2-naphthoate octaprenyltransferase
VTNRWLVGARPRTLPAAVVPVAVGTAVAYGIGPIIWWRAAAALVVSLALQIGTNYVNDYADGQRGTDDQNRVGPVRLVGSGLASASEVKRAAAMAFGIAGAFGAALALAVGPELLVVGALCMIAGWAYTGGPKPYGYLGLGEVMVFVFFGVVATVGSTYVQTSSVSRLSLVASVAVGLLAVALLVINNLRDIVGDSASGKTTLAVLVGESTTRTAFVAIFVLVAVAICVAAVSRPPAGVALVGLLAAIAPIRVVLGGARGALLIPVLGQVGRVQLLTGLLFAAGLAIGAK